MNHTIKPSVKLGALIPVFLFSFSWIAGAQESKTPSTPNTPAQQPEISYPKVIQAKGGDAKIYSLFDVNSTMLRELTAGELLIAKAERGGWFEVEVPGTFPCWVFSKYINETGELGMGTITDDRILARPLPNSDNKNYPVGRLRKGDQLRVLDHKGDWTQVQSISSIHAWVPKDSFTIVGDPEAYSAKIRELEASAESQWKERLTVLAKQKEEEATRNAAKQALDKADAAFAQEKAKGMSADFAGVLALYSEADAKVTDAAMKAQIQSKREQIASLETMRKDVSSAAELEKRSLAMQEEHRTATEKAMASAQERVKFSDPDKLKGRYDGTGWVKKSLSLTRGNVYTIEKGGVALFEISCSTGRYELSDFLGHEIGVKGVVTRPTGTEVPKIEISKMEILAAP